MLRVSSWRTVFAFASIRRQYALVVLRWRPQRVSLIRRRFLTLLHLHPERKIICSHLRNLLSLAHGQLDIHRGRPIVRRVSCCGHISLNPSHLPIQGLSTSPRLLVLRWPCSPLLECMRLIRFLKKFGRNELGLQPTFSEDR